MAIGCKRCSYRGWHINPKTRQREDCPHCKPARKQPQTKETEPKPKPEKKKEKSFSEGVGTDEQTSK